MLQSMHEKMQGLIAGIIAVAIALTFALWGVQNYLHGGSNTQVVAKVNGKEITRIQENIAYEQLKRNEMLKLGQDFSLDQKVQAQLKKNVREQLIKREVIYQYLTKMGFGVGKEQLWASIAGFPIFQINGHFSFDYFKQFVERFFYSQQLFFDNLKSSVLQAQLEEGIVDSAFDLPNEIENAKKILRQRRNFSYVVISPDIFAKTINVTEADIQKYYEQHQNDFTIPEKISLQYIELSSSALRSKINSSQNQLKQYYQSHINLFSTPKKWQVTRTLLPLPQVVSKDVSNDAQKKLKEASASGDLTKITDAQTAKVWVTQNEMKVAFATDPDKLSVGQVSKPLRTKDGYIVEKILAIQPETVEPYQSVVAKVKQAYERQQLAQLFSEANDKLVDLTYTNSDSLEPAAKELGLKIQKTDLITSTTRAKTGILANNKIVNAAFSESVLKQGYNSNPIEIEPGRFVVLRIKDHIPEVLQPLDKVRANITKELEVQAMQKSAYDFSQKLVTELRNGKDISELTKQYDLIWQTVTNASYDQSGDNAQLIEAAFSLAHPNANEIPVTIVDLPGEYAVLHLLKVYDGRSYNESSKEAESLKSLAEQLGRFEYQLLIDNLMNKASIKINEDSESK